MGANSQMLAQLKAAFSNLGLVKNNPGDIDFRVCCRIHFLDELVGAK